MSDQTSASVSQECGFIKKPRLTCVSSGAPAHLPAAARTVPEGTDTEKPLLLQVGKRRSTCPPTQPRQRRDTALTRASTRTHTRARTHTRLLELTHRPNRVPAPSQPKSLWRESPPSGVTSSEESASSLLCRTRKDPDARQEEKCLRQEGLGLPAPGATL